MVKLSYLNKKVNWFAKRGILLPLSLFLFLSTFAQNLVPNGSFEEIVECPTTYSEFQGYVSLWFNPVDDLPDISEPTPDFYHSCSNPSDFGVPNNATGYLIAKDGDAYSGLLLYFNNGSNFGREYIAVKLIESLIKDSLYNLKFSVSLAQNYTGLAISNIGVLLYSDSLFQYEATQITIPDSAIALKNNPDSIILNQGQWKDFDFIFKANGGEEFLYIGNFDGDNDIDSISFPSSPIPIYKDAYYLIDDVSLTRTTGVGIDENGIGNKIKVFPNPASNRLTIAVDKSLNRGFQLKLFDASGRFITNYPIQEEVNELDISTIANGLYIYDISQQGKVIQHGKIIIYK